MAMMRTTVLVMAVVVAVLFASNVEGQATCDEILTEQPCYDNRVTMQCGWDPFTSTCAVNTDPTCPELYRDTAGCAATPTCAVNSNNNVCYKPVTCTTFTTEAGCSTLPSSCSWDGVGCTPLISGCATHSVGTDCEANSCVFDLFAPSPLPKCVQSVGEMKTMVPDCQTWSNYPGLSGQDACVSHGCSYSSSTRLCTPISDGGSSETPSASLDVKFDIGSFMQTTGTTRYRFSVVIPFSQYFDPAAPAWHSITLGTPPDASAIGVATQPHICNTVRTAFPAFGTGAPLPSTHSSYSSLTNYFVSKVNPVSPAWQAFNQIGYATEDEIGMRQTIGDMNVAPAGQSIVWGVSSMSPFTDVTLFAEVDLDWAVANCGVVRETTSGPTADVTYRMPVTLEVRKGDSNAFSTLTPTFQFSAGASVVFFATSSDAVKINVQQLRDTPDEIVLTNVRTSAAAAVDEYTTVAIPPCGAFETRRAWVVRETWRSQIADSVVGLRDLRDVSMVYGGTREPTIVQTNTEQVGGSPTNAFGTRPIAVSPPTSCPNNECVTLIYFVTDCNAYSYGKDTLNWASFQPVDRQVALMGGTLQSPTPWPGTDGARSSLDTIHHFFHYPQQWSVTGAYPPTATPMGSDINGVNADQVEIRLNLDTQAVDGIYEGKVHFQCGILRNPESTVIEGNLIPLFTTNNEFPVTAADIAEASRNPHLANSGMLAIACAVQPELRNSFTMKIDVLEEVGFSPYRMTPVDSRGVAATNPDGSPTTQYLSWTELAYVSTYTPRQIEPLRLAPAAQGVSGVDVIATPVYWLNKLLPSPGFQIDFFATILFPSTDTHAGSPNVYKTLSLSMAMPRADDDDARKGRTLLQTGGTGTNTTGTPANSGNPSMVVGIPIDKNNTDWRYIQRIDLQNPSSRTQVETALTMSLSLGLMTIIGSMAFIKLPIKWTMTRMF